MKLRPFAGLAALAAAIACSSHPAPAPGASPPPAPPPRPAPPSNMPATPSAPSPPPAAAAPTDTSRPPAERATDAPEPMAPPSVAYRRGWMALDATGVTEFRRAHPEGDGRGVVIGILDSGIDAGAPGLQTTTTGSAKVLDLRDFSGEGRIALRRLTPRGDTLDVGGRRLRGASRVAALARSGAIYGGTLAEIDLGNAPAADLDGDGAASDTLPVVVARATDGWVVFIDADEDGSLANDRPVHDFLRARETFGWSVRGRPSQVTLAANLGEGDTPTLDLFFDTSGHGTHVAGIAAGHDIDAVKGFDGVAPGAQLLGLKIANDAQGGITVTGSMLRAIDYAIRFAAARRLPLVLNMSFGVGNEIEGTARIDAAIDSVLATHPELVFTISAGNDGPGLSTIGFPGSATRAVSVGALFPSAFLPPGAAAAGQGPASFSSRGGELAKPDLLTPGIAYSTVPRWDTGKEVKTGTSMAAPHAAGLAALLVGASRDSSVRGRPVDGRRIRQALMVTAQPVAGATYVDEGTGVPNVERALRWLAGGYAVPEVQVRSAEGVTAAYTVGVTRDSSYRFELTPGPGAAGAYTLKSDSPWLVAPEAVTLGASRASVTLTTRTPLPRDTVRVGVVSGWGADTAAGPAFRLVVTQASAEPAGRDLSLKTGAVAANRVARYFVGADSARPFSVRVATSPGQAALANLHEPHGMPFRDQGGRTAGSGTDAAVFHVDGRDARDGVYEVDVVAPPSQSTAADVVVRHSPFTLDAVRTGDGVTATMHNVSALPAKPGVAALLAGAERDQHVSETTSAPRRIPFSIPAWAKAVVIDVRMDPAQWSRFTDFGVTLFDSSGRQIAQSPLNYALGRLQADLPPDHGPIQAEVGLFPGFAEPGDERWSVDLALKVYADSVAQLPPTGAAPSTVDAGRRATMTFAAPTPPWPLGEGFLPLTVFVLDVGGETWTREVRLGGPPSATR